MSLFGRKYIHSLSELKPSTYPLMPNMDDCLCIALDKHQGEATLLTVARIKGEDRQIINMFKNEEAEELYKKLVDWDNKN